MLGGVGSRRRGAWLGVEAVRKAEGEEEVGGEGEAEGGGEGLEEK